MMYCKECKFYEDRFCYYEPTKSFRLWGDEKACDNFIVNDEIQEEHKGQKHFEFGSEANANLNDWTKLKMSGDCGVKF